MDTSIVPQDQQSTTDFVPETFGRLTTLDTGYMVNFGKERRKCHMVRCECSNVKQVQRRSLVAGTTQSCGCQIGVIHGHLIGVSKGVKRLPEYTAHRNMLARCYNENNTFYPDYGGRGIRVFPEWLGPKGFETWFAHIGSRPSPEHSLDRIDVNGDYAPGNVRWATREEQSNNKRNNVQLTHENQTKSISQWAKITGIHRTTIKSRLLAGWPVADTLTLHPSPLPLDSRTSRH